VGRLPDLEGLAIFAKVVESRSFAGAAAELQLSKATVSKAVSRVEARLGARLINRTSRRLALTDAGRLLADRAAQILADGEAAEDAALAQATQPRGRVRLAAPMSFGVLNIAPLLPEFLATYPEVSIDLHVSDAMVDLIGEGFDAAIRIAVLPDSSLIVRRLCEMPRYLVGSPDYLSKHGRPRHPLHLAEHRCIGYSYAMTAETWRFAKGDKSATVRTAGPLRVNNGDAMMPALIAGHRYPARIHFARRTRRRPAGTTAARLVSASRCCLLGHAARWTAAQAGRGPRRFPGREVRPACEARNYCGVHEHAQAGRQGQAAMKSRRSCRTRPATDADSAMSFGRRLSHSFTTATAM
jgi:DNA-binding transcriptional LysR family regulator